MPRPINRLTARSAQALKAPGWHADGGGLYLRIQDGGRKSWVIVSTKGGKRTERGLGAFAELTLAQARQARDEPPAPPSAAPTFAEWADGFVAGLESGWKNEVHRAH